MQYIDENLQCSITREIVIPDCIYFYLTQSNIILCHRKLHYQINLFKGIGTITIKASIHCGLFLWKSPRCQCWRTETWFLPESSLSAPPHSYTHTPQTMLKAETNFLTQTEKSLARQMTINCMAKCIWPQGCHSYFSWQFIMAY